MAFLFSLLKAAKRTVGVRVLLLQFLLIMILISVVIIRYRWLAGGECQASSFLNYSMSPASQMKKISTALTHPVDNTEAPHDFVGI